MQDTGYKRLIDAARDRAFFGFMALVQRAMQDADRLTGESMAKAKSSLERTALTSLRHFLQQDSNVFLRRIDMRYRGYLERAMQTMYIDMRPELRNVSIDELTLIDDEMVNHQIEVGRLTDRMREASAESIGRLNVIVAQLHGEREARERENPFRPYLLARALYDAVRETVGDEAKGRLLFEQLSNALIPHLPQYYGAIREVFESSGLRGKFVTMPSRSSPYQRYFGAPIDRHPMPAYLESRLAPGLQRLLESFQQMAGAGQAADGGSPPMAQDLIRRMFSASRMPMMHGGQPAAASGGNGGLVAQLGEYQKQSARGQRLDESAQAGGNQLFALREKLDLGKASMMERMTVDVVAMLFEFILDDQQIPAELRKHIARLQIPVLKAAMLEPDLLHEESHPVRQLLNRLSSAALAATPATDAGRALAAEIERITEHILSGFDTDIRLFTDSLRDFERFLNEHLRRDDRATERATDAIEVAEKISVLLTNVTSKLCDVLLPLNVDKRISDFIIHVWPHVLVHAAWQDMEGNLPPGAPDSQFLQYRAVLPELLWSIQEKQNPLERNALIKLLPDLVKRLNKALRLIQLPDDECKEILDLLVAMHTQVLRTNPKPGAKKPGELDELQRDFARLVIHWERVSWELEDPPQVRPDLIEEVFARRGIEAELNLDADNAAPNPADREFLGQTYLLGTRVEFRADGEEPRPAQLVWISNHRSLYLFRRERDAELVVQTSASLLEALARGTLVPVEYAPVFERAVESLLFGAEKLAAAT